MIRNEQECREAVTRLKEEKNRIAVQREEFEKLGLSPTETKRALDPFQSFHLQLEEEIESYEKLKRGEIDELTSLRGLGPLLICLRIACGISQRDLAEKLGVHESQVSRDERNEYHGVTLDRTAKILDALGVQLKINALIPSDHAALV